MRLFVDLASTQDPVSAERGIPTYARELAREIERIDPELVTAYTVESAGPLPSGLDFLLPGGKLRRVKNGRVGVHGHDRLDVDVWHDLSPFYDMSREYVRFVTEGHAKLIVTVYDLIPLIFDEMYLPAMITRANYYRSLAIVQHADHVMCISQSAADDVISLLGLDPAKVTVVGTGVEARYQPTPDRHGAYRSAARGVQGLRQNFLLYTGGNDHRKNVDGLLEAYSLLPAELRRQHQLVVVFRLSPEARREFTERASALGIVDDVLFTGFVNADDLQWLYQSARLFVFPSLYEGFGLPAAEALMCGTPSIVGDNSSLVEVMPLAEARFDATDPSDIARAMVAGLTDERFREKLLEVAARSDFSWSRVAEKVEAVYRSFSEYESPGIRTAPNGARTKLALVSPMPPSGVDGAAYGRDLLDALIAAGDVDVDVFTQAEAERVALPGVRWFQYEAYELVTTLNGPYDDAVYIVGNNPAHFAVLDLLRREQRGTVISLDVILQDVHSKAMSTRPDLISQRTRSILDNRELGLLPEAQLHYRAHSVQTYYNYNSPLTEELVEQATRFFVHSQAAATIVRLEGPADQVAKVQVAPFGHPPVVDGGAARASADASGGGSTDASASVAADATDARDVILSIGELLDADEAVTLVDAFAVVSRVDPDMRFVLIGENRLRGDDLRRFERHVENARLGERLQLIGAPTSGERERWLGQAVIDVQLRSRYPGESSTAIAASFSAGVPVIATNAAALRELPGDAILRLPAEADAAALAAAVGELLGDETRRQSLIEAGRGYARANSFAAVARVILDR